MSQDMPNMETSLSSSLTKGKLIIHIPLALPRNESARRPTGKDPGIFCERLLQFGSRSKGLTVRS